MRNIGFAVVALGLLARVPVAAGQAHDTFDVDFGVEVPLTLAGGFLWIAPTVIDPELPSGFCAPCDPDNVNALDRTVIGNHSEAASVGATCCRPCFRSERSRCRR